MNKLFIRELDENIGFIDFGLAHGDHPIADSTYFESCMVNENTTYIERYGGHISLPKNVAVSIGFAQGEIRGIVRTPLFVGEAYGLTDLIIPSQANLNVCLDSKHHLFLNGKRIRSRRYNSGPSFLKAAGDMIEKASKEDITSFTELNGGIYVRQPSCPDELDACIEHKILHVEQRHGILRVRRLVVPTGKLFSDSEQAVPVQIQVSLEEQLRKAVEDERYEDAAQLRMRMDGEEKQ